MNKTNFIIFLMVGFSIVSCGKNDKDVYSEADRSLNIWLGSATTKEDSSVYNFSLKPVRDIDSITFVGRLMGRISDKDISFKLKPVGGDTNKIKEGIHYKLGNYTIKAGKYIGEFPIYIIRTTDFKNQYYSIDFELQPNTEISQGVKDRSRIKLVMLDMFTKPFNWDTETSPYRALSAYFGTYSLVKFQYITTVTRVAPTYRVLGSGTVVKTEDIYPTQAVEYKRSCAVSLAEYNATHATPLKDENGNNIAF